jgi:SpoVK/Ycf46/Vps4 family AAA+-type ATPase
MAAEIIANELGLDLFRIDLASVVSKYIGETEKNLERIFAAAVRSNSVLLFDEADALFGKRSAVTDAHDRYANVEISYLLQKMEQYEGITILTSNLRGNIDEGFWRRLAFTVHFPFPETDTRLEIWKRLWPEETALEADVDFAKLAEHFSLSGANIRNIGLAAAFLAAAEKRPVRMADILHATRREYTKVGKAVTAIELEDMVQ